MPKKTNELMKLTKVIHPKSRKSAAIFKRMKKTTAREKSKLIHHMKQNLIGEKLLWFRDNSDIEVAKYTPELTLELIEKYLNRFEDELQQIQLKHNIGQRKNRQHASREDIIKLTKQQEEEEFETCGIEMPNLLDDKQLDCLRKWNGELRFLQNFNLIRFNRRTLSSFEVIKCDEHYHTNTENSLKQQASPEPMESDSN